MAERPPLRVVVRGIGDVSSAIAHRLFRAGYAVVIHDSPQPTVTRRGMAFADAVFEGRAILEGVQAVRTDDATHLPTVLSDRSVIPVVVTDLAETLAVVRADVLVDARMRKRVRPEVQLGLAPLTIGLGPGFVGGETTDLVVETSWEALGQVVTSGSALPLAGEPHPIDGFRRERYVYAPVAGVFHTRSRIGDLVAAGEAIAQIGMTALAAPLAGVIRGLTRDGVPVSTGTKVVEIDPRSDMPMVRGIGERPGRIADGVLEAIHMWLKARRPGA
jgi:xanthine dehydrogenase accessory factor